jgi:hypothetical protein
MIPAGTFVVHILHAVACIVIYFDACNRIGCLGVVSKHSTWGYGSVRMYDGMIRGGGTLQIM